ncbi:hypothetical protein [Corynebacterium meridianum]|uniref:NYN domain-containing protein n=1 Tax=Corynebacterium meridianum TaxID=2765363 RepID=A0A934I6J4_9CORY|nr:hypothetical protein [Corynebacterium meridianum]MBI8988158.1 hypothetical protein [Corynebacterium meridianum]
MIGHNGPNGADQALLSNIDPHLIARRYDRVVIASADNAFINLADTIAGHHTIVEHVCASPSSTRYRAITGPPTHIWAGPHSTQHPHAA